MNYTEVILKAISAGITSALAVLAATGGNLTQMAYISAAIAFLYGGWNMFLQLKSPDVIAGTTAHTVNWAAKLRRY